jgi:hypothetical protein
MWVSPMFIQLLSERLASAQEDRATQSGSAEDSDDEGTRRRGPASVVKIRILTVPREEDE